MMRMARLGSNGPELSVIGFGAWEVGGSDFLGPAPPREQRVEAVRSVFDTSVNWIDTAEVYGSGTSEEIVALAIQGHREEILLATKVAPAPEGSGFRPGEVRRACIESLRRLRTGHLDLYQLHWPDESGVPLEETWGAMAGLVDEGLARWIGMSNFDREQIMRCEAVRHVDSLQQEFSMLVLQDRELIGWCGEQGTGVLAYGPLGYGLLSGAITEGSVFDTRDFRGGLDEWDYWQRLFAPGRLERSLAVVEGMRPVAERLGVPVAHVALAWAANQPGVTSAIAGSRNPEHVRSNAAAGDLELDEPTLAELEALLSLGPGLA
jgi:aryl-alcohol dehydrogenase-like predicted oxidoreductase